MSTFVVAQNATIEGYIVESETGEWLPGANVILAGTGMGASSTVDGKYSILNVPPGSYTMQVSYIGYQTVEQAIQVAAGEKLEKHFELTHAALEGETIEVTAQAEGQMEAINKQLSARQIMNAVASDRIEELPDANAAESVGRLPGVSVLREGGEGNKIVIRGLSPKYNAVMIEGVRMASTDFDDRSSDLSMISPYMLEGIEVMKAITPDQDADILGGSVNFKIKEARDVGIEGSGEGFGKTWPITYDVIARGGYNGLKQTYNDYKIVANVSTRLMDNRFGILGQVDVERRNRSSNEMGASYILKGPALDQVNPSYISALNLNDITRDRERYGGTLSLDYRLPAGKITLKNLFSLAETSVQNRGEIYNTDANEHWYSTTDTRNKLNVVTNVLNFEHQFSILKFDANVSHTLSENKAPDNLKFQFREYSALVERPERLHPTDLPGFAKNLIEETEFNDISDFDQWARDQQIETGANAEISFTHSNLISSKLKFGGKYRYKNRLYDYNLRSGVFYLGSAVVTRTAILNAFPWMREWSPTGNSNLYYPGFIDPNYDSGEFLKGDYTLGPVADIDLMWKLRDVVREVNELETYMFRSYQSVTNDYNGNEYMSAGYIMADINIGPNLKLIPGVRYEHNKRSYTAPRGNSTFPRPDVQYMYDDTTIAQTNDYWLPMAHVRYKPLPWFDIRFAYTNTLTRPDFRTIIPRWNIAMNSVSWNNYRLKPAKSQNFDLYFSVYENRVGLFTLGGFIKQIDDLVFAQTRVIDDPDEYGLPSSTEGFEIYTQINNSNRVNLWGIEVDWQTHLWYLPGFLKNIVLNTNYTHIFSEAKYPRTVVTVEYEFFPVYRIIKTYDYTFYADRMLHQPDDIVNASIGYDYKDFSVRFSMLYQSNIFKGTDFWSELRSITDDYIRWDVSMKQDLPWFGLQIFANGINLSSTLDRDLNQGSLFPTAEQHYGWAFDIGIRWKN
jgi:TonB-dependent receptor